MLACRIITFGVLRYYLCIIASAIQQGNSLASVIQQGTSINALAEVDPYLVLKYCYLIFSSILLLDVLVRGKVPSFKIKPVNTIFVHLNFAQV